MADNPQTPPDVARLDFGGAPIELTIEYITGDIERVVVLAFAINEMSARLEFAREIVIIPMHRVHKFHIDRP